MNNFHWENFLKEESRKAIAKYQKEKNDPNCSWIDNLYLPPKVIESEWLGFPGATEEHIIAAENRLGVKLPPSYREFLKVTNGWNDRYPGTPILRPVEKINWFELENPGLSDDFAWMSDDEAVSDEEYFAYEQDWCYWDQPLRIEHMQTTLQISDDDDLDIVLLNPKVIHDDEWEAWVLSCDNGGVNRCRSFQAMIKRLGMVDSWV